MDRTAHNNARSTGSRKPLAVSSARPTHRTSPTPVLRVSWPRAFYCRDARKCTKCEKVEKRTQQQPKRVHQAPDGDSVSSAVKNTYEEEREASQAGWERCGSLPSGCQKKKYMSDLRDF